MFNYLYKALLLLVMVFHVLLIHADSCPSIGRFWDKVPNKSLKKEVGIYIDSNDADQLRYLLLNCSVGPDINQSVLYWLSKIDYHENWSEHSNVTFVERIITKSNLNESISAKDLKKLLRKENFLNEGIWNTYGPDPYIAAYLLKTFCNDKACPLKDLSYTKSDFDDISSSASRKLIDILLYNVGISNPIYWQPEKAVQASIFDPKDKIFQNLVAQKYTIQSRLVGRALSCNQNVPEEEPGDTSLSSNAFNNLINEMPSSYSESDIFDLKLMLWSTSICPKVLNLEYDQSRFADYTKKYCGTNKKCLDDITTDQDEFWDDVINNVDMVVERLRDIFMIIYNDKALLKNICEVSNSEMRKAIMKPANTKNLDSLICSLNQVYHSERLSDLNLPY